MLDTTAGIRANTTSKYSLSLLMHEHLPKTSIKLNSAGFLTAKKTSGDVPVYDPVAVNFSQHLHNKQKEKCDSLPVS